MAPHWCLGTKGGGEELLCATCPLDVWKKR